jgi:hypothetical protein
MTPYQHRMNEFVRRMAEDMQLRNFVQSTIDAYTYHVDKFCNSLVSAQTSSARNSSVKSNSIWSTA